MRLPRPAPSLLALCAALALLPAAPAAAAAPSVKRAAAAPAGPVAEAPADAAPDGLRLPRHTVPLSAELALRIDPDDTAFSGSVSYELRVQPAPGQAPVRELLLHAQGLSIAQAWAESGAQKQPARVSRRDDAHIVLRFARPIGPQARLTLHFSGSMAVAGIQGLSRHRDAATRADGSGARGGWLAVTQLEPVAARRVFPSFDEPGFKIPWTLTLHIPPGEQAVANMPLAPARRAGEQAGEAAEGSAVAAPAGWQTLHFATTPPLPSYLVALAVGRFETVPAGQVGDVALRILTPPGRAADAATAAALSAPVLQALEGWFGMPMPYAKADQLAVPYVSRVGAMENPGLITWQDGLLLPRAGQGGKTGEDQLLVTMAHELAHQWFGNLVTLAWWDDLWLNESFASWLGVRIAGQVRPGPNWVLQPVRSRAWAMALDELASTRAVWRPVRTADDLGDLFNPITYQKGESLLQMAEAWLGEQTFRDAVRRYIGRHAWGNATRADFFRALGEADAGLAQALVPLVEQSGIPLLRAELLCADGPPRLRLQSLRLPGPGRADSPSPWTLPLRLRSPAGQQRLMLAPGAPTELALPDTRCPDWVQANVGGAGYYVVDHRGPAASAPPAALPAPALDHNLLRLAAQPDLPPGERLALMTDAARLLRAGLLSPAVALALVGHHAASADPDVQQAAVWLMRDLMRPLAQAPGAANAEVRRWVAERWRQLFGDAARRLGWRPGPDEPASASWLRDNLVAQVAGDGADAALRAQALAMVRDWLARRPGASGPPPPADPALALPPGRLRRAVFAAAGQTGDAALFDALMAAWQQPLRLDERQLVAQALGHFDDPQRAAQARGLLLAPAGDVAPLLWGVLGSQARRAATRSDALDWLGQHHAALLSRADADEAAEWPELFDLGCSEAEARQLGRELGGPAARLPGGRQALALAQERVRLCAAQPLP